MKKERLSKKGVSPLIATVLLIGAVLVIAIIVWLLFRGIVVGNVEKVDCGATEQLALDISATCSYSDTSIFTIGVSNSGQEKIDGILVVAYYGDGTASGLPASLITIKPGTDGSISYNNPQGQSPSNVEVIPAVVKEAGDKNKLVVCTDKLQKVTCSSN